MIVLLHVEIHGLVGYTPELSGVLSEHADRVCQADGSLGATAYEPLGSEPGEFVIDEWWRDEEALRAHYATPEYANYARLVGPLIARPTSATVHSVERSVRAVADLSLDPTRQG